MGILPRLLLACALVLSAGCKQAPPDFPPSLVTPQEPLPAPHGARRNLVIAVTGDLKGWITSDTLYPRRKPHGLAHLAPAIHKLRKDHPGLILLDGGDAFSGAPNAAMGSEAQAPFVSDSSKAAHPSPLVGVMNQLGYDAMVLGNMDFSLGWQALRGIRENAGFPVLSANLLRKGRRVLPAYHLLERQGVRVAVLGLTTPRAVIGRGPELLEDARFLALRDTVRYWARWLRDVQGADVVIGLFHSGLDDDFGREEALRTGAALFSGTGKIADEEIGLDLVVSADAHRLSPKRRSGAPLDYTLPVVEPGAFGRAMAVVRMSLVAAKGHWRVNQVRREVSLAERVPDLKILSSVEGVLGRTRAWLAQPTRVVIKRRPSKKDFYYCAGRLSHLSLTSALAKNGFNVKPDSLLSLLPVWRWPGAGSFKKGQLLRRAHLHRWLPYKEDWMPVTITGRQIQLLLEPFVRQTRKWRVNPNLVLWPGGMHMDLPQKGSEVRALFQLQADGRMATLSPQAKYTVWMTRYIRYGGGGLALKSLLPIRDDASLVNTERFQPASSPSLREAVFGWLSQNPHASQLPSHALLPAPCDKWLQITQ